MILENGHSQEPGSGSTGGLMAGDAHREGEVFPPQNADAVLHYVIALEGLLAGDDSDRGDFIRKVSQRAAVLAGDNDAERLEIERLVRDAYKARSAYAHGSEPSKIDLAELRGVIRRCILARLILGDPTPAGPLHMLADRALLSHDELQSQIRRPFDEFTQRAGLARGLTRRDHAGRGRSRQTDAPS